MQIPFGFCCIFKKQSNVFERLHDKSITMRVFYIAIGLIAMFSSGSKSQSTRITGPTNQIELFDTTDCVYKVFWQNMNPKCIEAHAVKSKQNRKEIQPITIDVISQNDTTLIDQTYYNTLIGLKFKKNYKSGQISACGFEISNAKVGKWKFFSPQGVLESIVDYSSQYGVNYCEFFAMARAFGMVVENSRMPDRKRLIEIADSLKLKNCNRTYANQYWLNFEFYPINVEEKEGHFRSEISYSNIPGSKVWTVCKYFSFTNKRLCFYLSFYPETKEICIYECFSDSEPLRL